MLADLVVAECVYVLESFYEVKRSRVAEMMRSAIALPSIRVIDEVVLMRSLEVYEIAGIDFADAYLVASAEASGTTAIASFDKGIDRISTVKRVEP